MAGSRHFWIAGGAGVVFNFAVSYLVLHSLRDWDVYYRISTTAFGGFSFGLDYERGPALTKFVGSNMWILFVPPAMLVAALFMISRKSTHSIVGISCATALVTTSLGYLAAYLPVAKPDWWGGSRPTYLIEEARRYHETTKPEQGGADQPATAPESKSEGNPKPNSESEVRSQ